MFSPVCDQNISLWVLCVEERLRKVPDGGVKTWQIQDKLLRVLRNGADPGRRLNSQGSWELKRSTLLKAGG